MRCDAPRLFPARSSRFVMQSGMVLLQPYLPSAAQTFPLKALSRSEQHRVDLSEVLHHAHPLAKALGRADVLQASNNLCQHRSLLPPQIDIRLPSRDGGEYGRLAHFPHDGLNDAPLATNIHSVLSPSRKRTVQR